MTLFAVLISVINSAVFFILCYAKLAVAFHIVPILLAAVPAFYTNSYYRWYDWTFFGLYEGGLVAILLFCGLCSYYKSFELKDTLGHIPLLRGVRTALEQAGVNFDKMTTIESAALRIVKSMTPSALKKQVAINKAKLDRAEMDAGSGKELTSIGTGIEDDTVEDTDYDENTSDDAALKLPASVPQSTAHHKTKVGGPPQNSEGYAESNYGLEQ